MKEKANEANVRSRESDTLEMTFCEIPKVTIHACQAGLLKAKKTGNKIRNNPKDSFPRKNLVARSDYSQDNFYFYMLSLFLLFHRICMNACLCREI